MAAGAAHAVDEEVHLGDEGLEERARIALDEREQRAERGRRGLIALDGKCCDRLLAVGTLVIRLWHDRAGRRLSIAMLLLLVMQISLGVANVVLTLPLVVAVCHNATGALLLLGVITVNYRSFRSEAPR